MTSKSRGFGSLPAVGPGVSRRAALGLIGSAALAGAAHASDSTDIDVTGVSPSLSFAMPATPDGRVMTQDDCRGVVTMLYFGYTFCPDVCPLVMQNATDALARMGQAAAKVRFLFVTVDPARDTIPVLTDYTRAFGTPFVGLRGDADALEKLTRRFRIAWSVTPSADPRMYEVSHSSAIYLFDRESNARFLVPSMASATPDLDGVARDLTALVNEAPSRWGWLRGLA